MSRVGLAAMVTALGVAVSAGSPASTPQPILVFASDRAENLFSEIYVARADGHGSRNLSRSPYADYGATLSPSGCLLAFISERDGRAVYVVGVDGSGLRRLTQPIRTPLGGPGFLSWSPDGQRLVFSGSGVDVVDLRGHRNRIASFGLLATWSPDGARIAYEKLPVPSHVFVVSPNGRYLWSSPGSLPKWSPDGSKVAVTKGHCPSCETIIRGASGRRLASYPDSFVAWSPDGSRLVLAARDGHYLLVRLRRPGALTLTGDGPAAGRAAVWSPDGTRLAFTDDRGTWTVRPSGGDRRLIARGGEVAGWSPDSTRLALASYRSAIVIVRADGSGRLHIARAPSGSDVSVVAWTPDGAGVIYESEHDRNDTELYTMRGDGSHLRRLTNDMHMEFSPAWSPDGRRIAYSWARACCPDIGAVLPPGYIQVMDADGSRHLLLTRSYGDDSPAWSPDGRSIVLSHTDVDQYGNEQQGSELELVASDGSAPPTTLYASNARVRDPAWSPDGTKIAFASTEDGGGIFTIRPDGSGLTKLVSPPTDPEYARSPAWSPDGLKLAFAGADGAYVVNSDGTGLERILSQPAGGLDWAPQNTIAFSDGDIYTIDPDGTRLRRLTKNPAGDGSPSWGPR